MNWTEMNHRNNTSIWSLVQTLVSDNLSYIYITRDLFTVKRRSSKEYRKTVILPMS